jgi:hypothetical protein
MSKPSTGVRSYGTNPVLTNISTPSYTRLRALTYTPTYSGPSSYSYKPFRSSSYHHTPSYLTPGYPYNNHHSGLRNSISHHHTPYGSRNNDPEFIGFLIGFFVVLFALLVGSIVFCMCRRRKTRPVQRSFIDRLPELTEAYSSPATAPSPSVIEIKSSSNCVHCSSWTEGHKGLRCLFCSAVKQ